MCLLCLFRARRKKSCPLRCAASPSFPSLFMRPRSSTRYRLSQPNLLLAERTRQKLTCRARGHCQEYSPPNMVALEISPLFALPVALKPFLSIRASVWRVLLGADCIGRPRPELDLAIAPLDPNLDRARIYQAKRCRERDLGGVTAYSNTHQAI